MLLTFYDFPANMDMDLADRPTRLRAHSPRSRGWAIAVCKGNGSRTACLTMVFKLMQSTSKRWRLLKRFAAHARSEIAGVQFIELESNPK